MAFLLVNIFIFNLTGYFYNCFPATDLAIHQEAIWKIASFDSFNPYLQIRGLKIFNDHFDPIIFLAVPFAWIFNYHLVGLLVFQMSWFVGAFILYYLDWKKQNKKEASLLILGFFFIILTRGVLGGLAFPLHPVTWSIFPLFLFVRFMRDENIKGIILSAFFLCFFKEIFPYGLLFLSFYYLWRKKYTLFYSLFLISLAFLGFIYFGRPYFLGETFPYSQRILGPLLENPPLFFINLIKGFDYSAFIFLFMPFLLPIFLIVKNDILPIKDKWGHFLIPSFIFLIPLIGIHGLSNAFLNWNGASFASVCLAVVLFSGVGRKILANKIYLFLTLGLFVMSSYKFHEKMIKLAIFHKSRTCEISKERKVELLLLREKMQSLPKKARVLVTTGLLPWATRKDRFYFTAREYTKRNGNFDYLILEKNNSGFLTPFSVSDIDHFVQICPGVESIIETKNITFRKGPFSENCLKTIFLEN